MAFMIRSETLEKLKKPIENAITLINTAIDEKRPVWIRHHADCDGYCGAVALERVILKRVYDVHRRESDIYHYYRRLPSRTPYYDFSDSVKDITGMLSEMKRFSQKVPLVIVLDNGSSREDTLALKKLKVYDAQIIVIDHHPCSPENDAYIDVHINPLLVDTYSSLSAGMLGAEIAHMMDKDAEGMHLLAALAGIADRYRNNEMSQYLDLAQGYDKESLAAIAEVIDFETFHIGYQESRYLVDDLLFSDLEKQKRIMDMIRPEIEMRKSEMRKAIEKYVEHEEHGGFVIARLDIDSITHSGEYPLRGKTTGIAKDYLEQKLGRQVVMLGYGKTFITFRISHDLELDMNRIRVHLEERFPYALIKGGGHAKAGTIRFNSASADEILSETIRFIKGE